jgi:hypothetical protein
MTGRPRTRDLPATLQDGSSELTRGASPPTIDLVIVYNKTTSPFLELFLSRVDQLKKRAPQRH